MKEQSTMNKTDNLKYDVSSQTNIFVRYSSFSQLNSKNTTFSDFHFKNY